MFITNNNPVLLIMGCGGLDKAIYLKQKVEKV